MDVEVLVKPEKQTNPNLRSDECKVENIGKQVYVTMTENKVHKKKTRAKHKTKAFAMMGAQEQRY